MDRPGERAGVLGERRPGDAQKEYEQAESGAKKFHGRLRRSESQEVTHVQSVRSPREILAALRTCLLYTSRCV